MFSRIFLFSLAILYPFSVGADQDLDEDLLFWKTFKDGQGLVYVYENVDLQASSFLAVCLSYQFNREIPVDGEIFLGPSSRNRIFEWKNYYDSKETEESYSKLQCYDSGSTCYKTEESKCTDMEVEKKEELPFGHCKKDMSMIINQQTLTISCGDEVVTAERCLGGDDKELLKITVKEFKEGVCATRIQPIKSDWIDILSGDSINRTVDLKSHSLIISQLMIREQNPDTTSFSMNFHTADSDNDSTDVLSIQLESGGPYMYKTSVTLTATVCSTGTASKKFYVGKELGKTQIQITLVGDQIAIIARDSANGNTQGEGIILLPSCDELRKELSMSVEDTTAERELSLIGNTNIKIIQKGHCSEPNVKEFNLHIKNEYSLQIGSKVVVDCEDPTYEIEGSDTVICQWNKTWSPQPFPGCVRKTCVGGKYLNKNGQCSVCPEGICDITKSENVCDEESLDQQGLKIADPESSHLLGSEVQVVCLDLMKEIVGNDKIHCVLTTDEDHDMRWFPVCEKKKCEAGKFLAFDGSCMDSICPKGQYAGEGSGECLECKSIKGGKFFSDTVGSADCKICDGEVDSRRTFCLQRDVNSQSPGSESSTKLYLYIAMAVVAVLVHALAFGIAKWREIQNSREKCGSEYFARRFKKYNSTSCSLRVLGKKQPEISIQYAFPDALLALEGEKHKKELEEKEVEEDGSGSPADGCDRKYNELNDDQEDNVNPGPVYEDMTCSSGQDVVVANTDNQSDEPTYLGISDIPFPNMDDEQPTGYEDVSIMPLPSNIDSVLAEDGKYSTLKKDGNGAPKSSAVKKKKTFKDIALSTLKKDGTMKKDLTKKKSASVDKKDDTLRRNTIKKTDNKITNNNSCSTIEDGVERYNALNQDGTEDTGATYTRISTRRKS